MGWIKVLVGIKYLLAVPDYNSVHSRTDDASFQCLCGRKYLSPFLKEVLNEG